MQKDKIQNAKFCRQYRKSFDICCFRWWCYNPRCLVVVGFSICICFEENGNSYGYFLSSCFGVSRPLSCSNFNFKICSKRFTHSKPNGF